MANEKNKFSLLVAAHQEYQQRSRLEAGAFSLLKDKGYLEFSRWAFELIDAYPDEAHAVFKGSAEQILAELRHMWTDVGHEDPATGVSMKFREWAVFFSNEMSRKVYDALVRERRKNVKN